MKTTSKKLLAALTIIILMLGMLPLNISRAASKPNVTVDSVDAKVGEEVTVSLKLDKKVTAASFVTTVKFDKTKLEVTNIEIVSLSNVLDKPTVENSNKQGEVMFMAVSAVNFDTEAGILGKITFRVKEGAAGKQNLTVKVDEVINVDSSYVSSDITDTVSATSGAINVVVPIETVTLDKTNGTLNVKETTDLVATVKPSNTTQDKTVTWTTSDEKVATVKDGKITTIDAIKILQYISKKVTQF